MDIKDARCTNCGASLKVEPQKTMTKCDYCQSTILVSNALELALVEVDKTKDIERYRSLLKDAIQKNSVGEILRLSGLIKDIIPTDFTANYYFAYAKQALNEPSFMMAFLDSKLPGTPEDIQGVVSHMIQRSDLRDKPAIKAFLSQVSPESIKKYEAAHQSRARQENQYANVMRDVFICHSSYDKEIAEAIVNTLEKEGFTCWISTRNLRPEDSENYWNNITKAIENTQLLLMVSSESAMLSKDVQRELEISQKNHQKRFEYKIDEAPHTVLFKHVFNGIKWVDGTENPLKQIHKLPTRVFEEISQRQETESQGHPKAIYQRPSRFKKLILPMIIILLLGATGIIMGMSGVFASQYTVEFIDYDGTLIDQHILDNESLIIYPDDPTRDGYTFTGWSSEPVTITEDLTIRAAYAINTYQVQFQDYDGTVLFTDTITHGSDAQPPSDPVREGYTFTGWQGDLTAIDSDTIVQATYDILTFNVRFNDHNGELIKQETVEYGASANPPQVQREGYDFAGWSQSTENVTENLVINPNYEIQTFTVTFEDYDGTVIDTQTVEYGLDLATMNEPDGLEREGYVLSDWYYGSNQTMPSNDLVVKAIYFPIGLEYIIENDEVTVTGYTGALNNIELPEVIDSHPVTTLGRNAFRFHDLIRITLPEGIRNIDSLSIAWSDLAELKLNENPNFVIKNNLLLNRDETVLIGGIGQMNIVNIPNTVKIIDNFAFDSNQLSDVMIPDSVVTIGESAFSHNLLTNVIIPDSVISIGDFAFYYNRLRNIDISESITNIGDSVFRDNDLTSVTIPEGVTNIGPWAFQYNKITEVVIPEGVTSIGPWAFAWKDITLFDIQNNPNFILENNLLLTSDKKQLIAGIGMIDRVEVPQGVETIFEGAFRDNRISNLEIPNSVKAINHSAFSNNLLTSLSIPDSVTHIGDFSFERNNLSILEISNSLEIIGRYTFNDNLLTNLEIPENVIIVDDYAFQNNRLTSVTIPESVNIIRYGAFLNNQLLEVRIEGDKTRFNDNWEEIGFPSELLPD